MACEKRLSNRALLFTGLGAVVVGLAGCSASIGLERRELRRHDVCQNDGQLRDGLWHGRDDGGTHDGLASGNGRGLVAEGRGDSEPGFRMELGVKDLRRAVAATDKADPNLPLPHAVHDRMAEAVHAGLGNKDWSAVAEYTRQRLGPGSTGRVR